jgi:hypothetical protein
MKKIILLSVFTLLSIVGYSQVPTPNAANGSQYCVGTTKVYGDQPLNAGSTYSFSIVPTQAFTPITTGSQFQVTWNTPGVYTLSLTETNASGCQAVYTATITVNNIGTATINPEQACEGSTALIPITGSNLGTSPIFSGTGVVGTNFNPTGLASGNYTVNVTSTTASGCPITGTVVFVINPLPTGTLNSD